MKEIAIIGPTASGKSALALQLAENFHANILSIDSLSIYKEIDIVSAKPNKEELKRVKHFGIDILYPNEHFSVARFIDIYKEAKEESLKEKKNLILVGGSSFYLKSLLDGISPMPHISQEIIYKVQNLIKKRQGYTFLQNIDPITAQKLNSTDTYRVQKALEIYFATNTPPSRYFQLHPPKRIASIPIFEIVIQRDLLRQRIFERTKKMVEAGLINEIAYLEKRYTRQPHPMKAIGIKETLDYLDGKIRSIQELIEKISIHTAQLAKRQITFNKTQFKQKTSLLPSELKEEVAKELAD
ncbi:tRNA (adenosine(37)-N6)-dimethylallyltransferase MiaA [Nitratiruptor sp. YY09-18]|uniref:tRNA (adenosine(37)-N6)-dimethylallyltransferase MiaA n=1 Tax=Nitratiruptor sp. YY09-18 TaxID=2724901 RepID=UPI0019156CE0|nr:tRNA (adenosine(37)-N6)-dimethylallyltransferase MiaA [Nitratiruptor sp. YY09-18]BCD67439.1 tRNA dimethylallyltransferase [Nitratiruptor sp. YY09-18]